jgi:hypothetical protein
MRAIAFALLLCASVANAADDGFAKWWPEFKTLVAQNGAKAIVKGSQFPMDWELLKVRKIDSEADFVAHFSAYFSADMKRAVATQKPVAIPGDQYMITWHARGNEYSLYFKRSSTGWALSALSEGPP